jgi:hypothetical protein
MIQFFKFISMNYFDIQTQLNMGLFHVTYLCDTTFSLIWTMLRTHPTKQYVPWEITHAMLHGPNVGQSNVKQTMCHVHCHQTSSNDI